MHSTKKPLVSEEQGLSRSRTKAFPENLNMKKRRMAYNDTQEYKDKIGGISEPSVLNENSHEPARPSHQPLPDTRRDGTSGFSSADIKTSERLIFPLKIGCGDQSRLY